MRLFVAKKRVCGPVEFNDSLFAEIQTFGIGGIKEYTLLGTLQVHPKRMTVLEEQFQQKFRLGRVLDITTTVETKAS